MRSRFLVLYLLICPGAFHPASGAVLLHPLPVREIESGDCWRERPATILPMVAFASLATSEEQSLQLARTIRQSLPGTARCPVWLFSCDRALTWSDEARSDLRALGVRVIRFKPDLCLEQMSFASALCAAALAEAMAEAHAEYLIWIDPSRPERIREGLAAAGQTMMEDPVLRRSRGHQTPEADLFLAVQGSGRLLDARGKFSCDLLTIRCHLETGPLIVRPAAGLFRHWRETVRRLQEVPPAPLLPGSEKGSELVRR